MIRTLLFVLAVVLSREVRAESLRLPDLPVVDRSGRSLAFRSEAIGSYRVVIAPIYTDCSTICPITIAIFRDLQELLGDRLGSEVRLLSLTVDPARDTPARLAEAAAAIGARDGWLWLTGRKPDLDRITAALGAWSADFTAHPPVILVGDGARGVWRRYYGFPEASELLAALDGRVE